MRPRTLTFTIVALGVIGGLALGGAPAVGQGPKSGGVLTVAQREDTPQGFAIHETSTVSTTWPAMPCFSNLVLFHPLKPQESADTVTGELAEKWSWQDHHRSLVFSLRKNVKWHDGQPFSSREIQKKLEEEAARPTLTWRVDNFTHWPQVKNLIPHNDFYNYGRLQEVWLDK